LLGKSICLILPLVVIVNGAEKQIEWLIYESVYGMAFQDDKFMRVVERIYENRHIGFETGYKKLRNKS
jgi:hypothetical protein